MNLAMRLLLLILLLLVAPCLAQVDRDPEKAVALLLNLYNRAGPRLGCRFVESCYLLTLADWRARGAWNGYLIPFPPEDEQRIADLNEWLKPQGLALELRQKPEGARLDIISLGGLEYTSNRSGTEWMQPYDRETGWEGRDQWMSAAKARLNALPTHTEPFHYLEGFLLGYPDVAVERYCSPAGDHTIDTADATIPAVARYQCGLPIFSLLAADCEHPEVTETEDNWQAFLEAVYDHPRLRKLTDSPEFLAARKEHIIAHARHLNPKSKSTGAERKYERSEDTASERLLRHDQGRLLHLLEKARSQDEFCQASGVSYAALQRWILRGALRPASSAAPIYRIARRRWPELCLNHLRWDLANAARRVPLADLRAGRPIAWKASYGDFLDLLGHPDFQAAYSRLAPEDRALVEEARAFLRPRWFVTRPVTFVTAVQARVV